jgi:hypothetical protein
MELASRQDLSVAAVTRWVAGTHGKENGVLCAFNIPNSRIAGISHWLQGLCCILWKAPLEGSFGKLVDLCYCFTSASVDVCSFLHATCLCPWNAGRDLID